MPIRYATGGRRSGDRRALWVRRRLGLLAAILLLAGPAAGQMVPGIVEREVDPRTNPFILRGSLSPEAPREGEVVEIGAEVTSRIFPHIRTLVRFFVDGEKREETAYVIAPRGESFVTHEWPAVAGEHAIRIEVASPAGVLYATWERRITVTGR